MIRAVFVGICFAWLSCSVGHAFQQDKVEFFESRIRPVLIEHCYACHNSIDQSEAGLAIDWRGGIRSKTEHGAVVVPGDAQRSVLMKVIKHEISGLEMPENSAKLDNQVIADFEKWIADGAVDPRLKPPTDAEFKADTSWEATLEQRKKWWSFQPIDPVAVPTKSTWSEHPIDRFIEVKLKEAELSPSQRAEPLTLLRRLSFAITGLPPTSDQIHSVKTGEASFDRLVDEMLASPQFGERWARHWMDVVRYADSHGSEGDPDIPNAYQYRDYLIRAFNNDVPFDLLVREHLAGDLLENPRINQELQINESAIGPAHLRLCFHGFAPTDALDEKVRFTDDQINVISKAFMGLTVSCARCHDHKFDAISQADYYALFGILGSCRPGMRDARFVDESDLRKQMQELKVQIKSDLIKAWKEKTNLGDQWSAKVQAANDASHSLNLFKRISEEIAQGSTFEAAWNLELKRWTESKDRSNNLQSSHEWKLGTQDDFKDWSVDGSGKLRPTSAGEFTLSPDGKSAIASILPSGLYSNLLTSRDRAVVGSPRFKIDDSMSVWIRQSGGGQANVRYVIQNYPRGGTVYPIKDIKTDAWKWRNFDLTYWEGDHGHLEWVTALDAPIQIKNSDRSWFGIRDVLIRPKSWGAPENRQHEFMDAVFVYCQTRAPSSMQELKDRFEAAISAAIDAWKSNQLSDAQALLLDAAIRDGLLNNKSNSLGISELIQQFKNLEAKLASPFRVPGVHEAKAFDQPLFQRGDHKLPLAPVRRRFLEAIDDTPYETGLSGRLELANDLVRPDNPLTSRVIVNRIWHHLFGKGIVSTPDNFGLLGSKPTHPELLDYLAIKMKNEGWSVKKMIRFMVKSKAWQQSSFASPNSKQLDPDNNLLSHANLRRLDAEAIRDSMLLVSDRLQTNLYGPSFNPNSNTPRRSIYVKSKRNNMDRFLSVFDSPVPFAPTGRRNETNVPAQSLTMLNSPMVVGLAESWAASNRSEDVDQVVGTMFLNAIARDPSSEERQFLLDYHDLAKRENGMATETEIADEIELLQGRLEKILLPIRQELLSKLDSKTTAEGPSPFASWKFDSGSLVDSIGGLKLTLKGKARLKDGALVVDHDGFAATNPIPKTIVERTLEACVQLNSLDQRSGGVITIQTLDGHKFDSITYAELSPRKWLTGSNNHVRTQSFGGPAESNLEIVYLAISYHADGKIAAYRNGQPYGKVIHKNNIQTYAENDSQIVLGIRHGTNPNRSDRLISAKIFEARLYDRALNGEEIRASFEGQPYVSNADVLERLSEADREHVSLLENQITSAKRRLTQIKKEIGPKDPLARVAHAIFNLKEFIYIR